ncbi:hypothetical protein [Sphingobacterium sp.]|uniref:hypothetical protein n=1 Tax=Sphingobacterium sp. TaxID=341027 RepID=UPI0028A90EC1|nr:hypothetical protein [Sphingobacterium sp.]
MENNNKKNDIGLSFEKFARHITPQPTESKEKSDDKFVRWGDMDNLYPNFLIDLASKSAIHGSILNSKSNYIFGDGIIDKKSKEFFGEDFNINSEFESLAELMRKAINDLVFFNSFAIKVEFNRLDEPIHYSHIPLHHVRLNKAKTKVFVNQDWYNNPRTYLVYDRYNPKVQYDNGFTKVFYFESYHVSVNNTYSTPDYYGCIESAVTDGLINELFKNNIANGFSLTKIMQIYGSRPDAETIQNSTKKFKDVLTGTTGEGVIFNHPIDENQRITVDTIPADDYASKLVEVIKKVERNILSAHSATSSLLFGVEKEGSLGNATELENAFQLFKDNYVKDKRGEIVGAFNRLFTNDLRLPVIDLKDKEKLFKTELQSSTKEKVMTINELRMEAGLEKIEGGDRLLLDTEVKPQPFYQPNQFSKKKDDEELEGYFATEEDFEKIKHLGTDKNQFITLSKAEFSECGHYHFSSNYNSIEEYLLNNKVVGLTLDEIAMKIQNELGFNVSKIDVQQAIDILKNANLIDSKVNTKTGIIHTAPSAMVNGTTVEVYYDYQKRPEADGNTLIPTSRHFCTSVVNSNKYFSAMDIMSFSSAMGYDVMKYGGGWWKNRNTGEINKHCRHFWVPVRVIKK